MNINRMLNLIAPHYCLLCGTEGKLLCGWCKYDAIPPVPSRCYRCRQQMEDFATCASCRRQSRLKNVWIAGDYDGAVKALIHKLKFERGLSAAEQIAELMAEPLPYFPPTTIITFAPTATSRRRQRGYDQSELIAKHLAKLLSLPFHLLLLRQGQTRQVGASKTQRKQQLAEAFYPRHPQLIKGADILLLDDIITTGATIEAAAQVLKQAGAKNIRAAAFAQKS